MALRGPASGDAGDGLGRRHCAVDCPKDSLWLQPFQAGDRVKVVIIAVEMSHAVVQHDCGVDGIARLDSRVLTRQGSGQHAITGLNGQQGGKDRHHPLDRLHTQFND